MGHLWMQNMIWGSKLSIETNLKSMKNQFKSENDLLHAVKGQMMKTMGIVTLVVLELHPNYSYFL